MSITVHCPIVHFGNLGYFVTVLASLPTFLAFVVSEIIEQRQVRIFIFYDKNNVNEYQII